MDSYGSCLDPALAPKLVMKDPAVLETQLYGYGEKWSLLGSKPKSCPMLTTVQPVSISRPAGRCRRLSEGVTGADRRLVASREVPTVSGPVLIRPRRGARAARKLSTITAWMTLHERSCIAPRHDSWMLESRSHRSGCVTGLSTVRYVFTGSPGPPRYELTWSRSPSPGGRKVNGTGFANPGAFDVARPCPC